MSQINITVDAGTDAATIAVVRRAVEGAIVARDEQWANRIHGIVQTAADIVAEAVHEHYRMHRSDVMVSDGQRVAELALDVIRGALPDVIATVEMAVREATIVRAADGSISKVITRTVDADAA